MNPDIEVLVEYIGDDATAFNDAVKGEALSTRCTTTARASSTTRRAPSGRGSVHGRRRSADKIAIGVDSDQYLTASAEQQPLDPHLHAQAGRHGRATTRSRQEADGTFTEPGAGLRPGRGRRRLLRRRTRTLMTDDIIDAGRRRTSSRSSTGRSWCPTSPRRREPGRSATT